MDGYPLNLILAVATASATIFLGFLPTKSIRSEFFAGEALKAAIAWIFVAISSPPAIVHYHIFVAILCGGAWWKFRRDNALSGKMWLSIASGMGISIGVMLILGVTPRAYPPALTQPSQTLLLASIYLGGAVIGLAYVCYVMTRSGSAGSGIPGAIIQRYVELLFGLTLMRAVAMLSSCFLPGVRANFLSTLNVPAKIWSEIGISQNIVRECFAMSVFLLILAVIVLPAMAFFAQRIKSSLLLFSLCIVGIVTESLARFIFL